MAGYALSFALALVAVVPLTWVVRQFARWRGWVANPRPDRWHRRPTALSGGMAIFAAFLLSYLVRRPAELDGDALIVICGASMFVLGLVDDFFPLKPYAKLVGQIVVSTALTTGGMRLHFLQPEFLDQILSVFWLVAITNAFNLLDNLDGLASGVAAIAGGFLVYFCHAAGQHEAALLAAALSGAALGFLVWNINPASIFMGDCGSLFMGFILGSMGMATTAPGIRRNVVAMLAVPVFVLLIPIIDTTLVTFSRSLHGRPVSQGGRDHTSHRLVALGFSERTAAAVLWAGALAAGLLAVGLEYVAPPMTVFFIISALMVVGFVLLFLGRVKVYAPMTASALTSGRAFVPTLADFAYKRRIFEVLCDSTVVAMAYYGAFLLRFEGQLASAPYAAFRQGLPLVICAQMSMLLVRGHYRGIWRYTSIDDVGPMVKNVLAAGAASAVVLALLGNGFSWSVVIIDTALLLLGIGASRLAVRLIRQRVLPRSSEGGRKILIFGAGELGQVVLRLLLSRRDLGLVPVGFVDDDPATHGRVILGVRVLGSAECLGDANLRRDVQEVALADDNASPQRLEELQAILKRNQLRAWRLSFLSDAVPHHASAAARAG